MGGKLAGHPSLLVIHGRLGCAEENENVSVCAWGVHKISVVGERRRALLTFGQRAQGERELSTAQIRELVLPVPCLECF